MYIFSGITYALLRITSYSHYVLLRIDLQIPITRNNNNMELLYIDTELFRITRITFVLHGITLY